MKYFQEYFPEITDWEKEEIKVICPFHDDTNPSMSINPRKGYYKCFTCGASGTETKFYSEINKTSMSEALSLLSKLENTDSFLTFRGKLWSDKTKIDRVKQKYNVTDEIIDLFKLGIVEDDIGREYLGIPVYINGILMDIRKLNYLDLENVPKVQSSTQAETGLLIPQDLSEDKVNFIFEGEKDCMLANSLGINAFTLTGGSNALVNTKILNKFKDKEIILCYDNDLAGKKGMLKLNKQLKNIVKSIKYIDIGEVVEEDKEDFYDYIKKYDGSKFLFDLLPQYEFQDEEDIEDIKPLKEVLQDNIIEREVTSIVVVSSEFANSFIAPSEVVFKKVTDDPGVLLLNETESWELNNENIVEVLELIEEDAKNKNIIPKLMAFARIPSKEKGIKTTILSKKTVYKSIVSDSASHSASGNLEVYSFERLEVGIKYKITYKIFPHPTKQQKTVGIATSVKKISDLSNFVINKELLKPFVNTGTVEERLDKIFQSTKHYVAKHMDYKIWFVTDLVFHSLLEFEYTKKIKGTLDIFILGDTQIGKSETTSMLTQLYDFGHFVSLKTSTTLSLIGGSQKIDGGNCNTVGVLPRQHKGLVVLEEFSGANPNFIKTITDLRSSGRLRMARVAGEIDIPCVVRMISVSNPVNDESGKPRFLNTFSNGVEPIIELIRSAEDVARYDLFLLVTKNDTDNPFTTVLKGVPIPKKCYEHKINWVRTRTAENVLMTTEIKSYIWEKASELNKKFASDFPLFGTTTALKLARMSVALSALLVNTDETMENVIVTTEIVDYLVSFLNSIYDNEIFKLKEYANDYNEYSEATDKDISIFESLYPKFNVLLDELIKTSKTDKNTLKMLSGVNGDDFNPIFAKMVQQKWIKMAGYNLFPTIRYRKVYKKASKELANLGSSNLINDLGGG